MYESDTNVHNTHAYIQQAPRHITLHITIVFEGTVRINVGKSVLSESSLSWHF